MPIASSEAALAGTYDYRLVALSVLIAVLASYAALDLAGRVTAARGRRRFIWLVGGATAMGMGIWSMHYIGMLAYSLPVITMFSRFVIEARDHSGIVLRDSRLRPSHGMPAR
jgi:NO-binding membrane sensor protein with MHYT domain